MLPVHSPSSLFATSFTEKLVIFNDLQWLRFIKNDRAHMPLVMTEMDEL